MEHLKALTLNADFGLGNKGLKMKNTLAYLVPFESFKENVL